MIKNFETSKIKGYYVEFFKLWLKCNRPSTDYLIVIVIEIWTKFLDYTSLVRTISLRICRHGRNYSKFTKLRFRTCLLRFFKNIHKKSMFCICFTMFTRFLYLPVTDFKCNHYWLSNILIAIEANNFLHWIFILRNYSCLRVISRANYQFYY